MDFFTRRMSVTNSKSGETREVTHFQYVSWPDYGVPVMADTMLNFRHKVRAPSKPPLLRHIVAASEVWFCGIHAIC